jgi:glycosyltransferase involved in cell wall biosynthesis
VRSAGASTTDADDRFGDAGGDRVDPDCRVGAPGTTSSVEKRSATRKIFMRIAIVSTPFIRVPPAGYGGTELFCHELAEELHARGHDVTLFTTGGSAAPCRLRWLYPDPSWPPHPHDEILHATWAMSAAVAAGAEVVHLNSALGIPLSRLLDAPVVYTIHHHHEPATSRLYRAYPDVAYVAISHRQRELSAPLPGAVVIHHGLRPERYPPSEEEDGYLLHLGRYAPEKGTHLAIDVAAAAGLPLLLAGRTHAQDAAYFAAEVAPRLGRPGVEELGEADRSRKIALLRRARAVVCPLRWEEPFGLVAIEAMLSGTPVLGFARGSFPEIVEEGVTGFLAPPDDVAALARLASRLAGFDRAACARRARERFTASAMTDAYEALYRRVIAERNGRRRAGEADASSSGGEPARAWSLDPCAP